MKAIVRLVTDPAWWFTAVVIAIFTSLAASYFRDALSLVGAKISRRMKERRTRRLASEAREAQILAAYPVLFSVELSRTIIDLILFSVFVAAFFSLQPFGRLLIPEATTSENKAVFHLSIAVADMLFGALAIWVGFRAISRLRLVNMAQAEYCRKLNTDQQEKGTSTQRPNPKDGLIPRE